MAEKDPRQFRPARDNTDRRNFDADDDPLVELARIVSEDGGFYSGKAQKAVPLKQAAAEDRDAFSADLEAELMQELEYSMRSRQEQVPQTAAPQTTAPQERPSRAADPAPVAAPVAPAAARQAPVAVPDAIEEPEAEDVSFDQASADEEYRDPGELLRELQKQLGGFSHRIVQPANDQVEVSASNRAVDDLPADGPQWAPDEPGEREWDRDEPGPRQWDEDEPGAPQYLPSAEYAEPEGFATHYEESAPQENPFLTPGPGEWVEDPFTVAEQDPLDFPAGQAGRQESRWPADTGGWEAVSDEQLGTSPEDEEPRWSGTRRESQDSRIPDQPEEPLRAPPAWAAPAALGMAAQPGWRDRDAGRMAAAHKHAAASDGAQEADDGFEDQRYSASNPGRKVEEPANTGAGWLTSGRDVRRDLRPTIADFGNALKPAAAAVPAHMPSRVADQPLADFDAGAGLEDWTEQPFDSDADEFGTQQDPEFAPVSVGGARSAVKPAPPVARRRSRRAALTLASLVGVALLGGAVAAYLQTGDGGPDVPPPVIRADEGAVKVEAQSEPAAPETTAGDVVYNPPPGGEAPADEQLVDSAEEPKEVARVVLPEPQAPAEEPLARPLEGQNEPPVPSELPPNESLPAQNGPISPIGPRRVRTVVVRPDGTIVASSDAAAPTAPPDPAPPAQAAPAPEAPAADTTPAGEASTPGEPAGDPLRANPVRTTAITSPFDEQPSSPGSLIDEDPGTAPDPVPADPPPALDPEDAADETAEAPSILQPAAEAEPEPVTGAQAPAAAVAPAPPQQPAAASPPVQTAARVPAVPAPAPPGDGFVVQLSSQRSDAQARSSFTALQRQFPNVLGQYQPNIQQADLGAKGIYYRVRVGPMPSRAEAIRVCEALKAAGGTCFVGK